MALLASWLSLALGLWITAMLVPGFRVNGFRGALIVAAVFGVLHFLLGWLLFTVIGFSTLLIGFVFYFVTWWIVSAILLKVTDAITDSLSIDSFGTALIGSAVLSLVGAVGRWLFH